MRLRKHFLSGQCARRLSEENSNSHWLFSPIGSSPPQQDEIKNPRQSKDLQFHWSG